MSAGNYQIFASEKGIMRFNSATGQTDILVTWATDQEFAWAWVAVREHEEGRAEEEQRAQTHGPFHVFPLPGSAMRVNSETGVAEVLIDTNASTGKLYVWKVVGSGPEAEERWQHVRQQVQREQQSGLN